MKLSPAPWCGSPPASQQGWGGPQWLTISYLHRIRCARRQRWTCIGHAVPSPQAGWTPGGISPQSAGNLLRPSACPDAAPRGRRLPPNEWTPQLSPYVSAMRWTPSPAQDGSKEGFHRDVFFTNTSRGGEALKWDLSPNIQKQDGSPLISVWLRVARTSVLNSVLPFTYSTASHMGFSPQSPSPPAGKVEVQKREGRDLPRRRSGWGGGGATNTASTTPCSAAAKE